MIPGVTLIAQQNLLLIPTGIHIIIYNKILQLNHGVTIYDRAGDSHP